jgi:hypothetical protein
MNVQGSRLPSVGAYMRDNLGLSMPWPSEPSYVFVADVALSPRSAIVPSVALEPIVVHVAPCPFDGDVIVIVIVTVTIPKTYVGAKESEIISNHTATVESAPVWNGIVITVVILLVVMMDHDRNGYWFQA